jgi:hypothetical protein
MNETTSYDAVIKALQMLKRVRRLDGTVLLHEGILLSADTLLSERQCSDFVREVNALLSQYRNGSRPLVRALLGFDGGNVLIFNVLPFTLCLLFGKLEDAAVVERAGEEFLGKWADSLRLETGHGIRLPELNGELPEEGALSVSPEVLEVTVLEPAPVELPLVVEVIEVVRTPEPVAAPAVAGATVEAPAAASTSLGAVDSATWIAFRQKIENLLSKVLGRAQATRLIERELAAMGIDADGYLTASQFRPFGQIVVRKIKDKSLRKQLETEMLSHIENLRNGS